MNSHNKEGLSSTSFEDVAIIPVTPAIGGNLELTRQFFEIIKRSSKALILIGYATGVTPRAINPFIYETSQNVPVFILSNNPGDNHGIRRIAYGPQAEAVEAGAIPLREPNVNNQIEVASEIQSLITEGLFGQNLVQAVIDKFGSPVIMDTK